MAWDLLVTAITLVVVGISKFLEGAWISFVVIPAIVFVFLKIREHYREVSRNSACKGYLPLYALAYTSTS